MIEFKIPYKAIPTKVIPSLKQAKAYIEYEHGVYHDAAENCVDSVGNILDGLNHLFAERNNLGHVDTINWIAKNKTSLLPPSYHPYGTLLLSLMKAGQDDDAREVWEAFQTMNTTGRLRGNGLGHMLLNYALVAHSFSDHDIHSQKISSLTNQAEVSIDIWDERLSVIHETGKSNLHQCENSFTESIHTADLKMEAFQQKYLHDIKYAAPTELWGKREEAHITKSKWAFWAFTTLSISAGAAALAVPFYAGDYIADSFQMVRGNETVFSAKGPLLISATLVVTSLLLWSIRLQYRTYLSERHLAMDASEKKAFTESYLALRGDKNVSAESEAIVLASLFRPTQDGIIKDDAGGIDPSIASLLVKQATK